MNNSSLQRWDIFCRVVDNYGDIGVCWRLARQLSSEYGFAVRLWVDDLRTLIHIWPSAQNWPHQHLESVEVCLWQADFNNTISPADVVIEAFACELPASYIAAMATQKQSGHAPYWFNVEYLSAEPWVEDCHGLISIHPSTGLKKVFFFPGFTNKTGGLLCEKTLFQTRDLFLSQAHHQRQWLNSLGVETTEMQLLISLFAYENPSLGELVATWQQSPMPILCLVPEGKVLQSLNQALDCELSINQSIQSGQLSVQVIPFLSQQDYDRLLWACDFNFVRGEDSFIRAQWAGKPLIWQIYPQDDNVHLSKLDAFLSIYTETCPLELKNGIHQLWKRWNQAGDSAANLREIWRDVLKQRDKWGELGQNWAKKQNSLGDLASQLVQFCQKALY